MTLFLRLARGVLDRLQRVFSFAKAALAKRDHRCRPVRVWEREFEIEGAHVIDERGEVLARLLVVSSERVGVGNRVGEGSPCAGIVNPGKGVRGFVEAERQSQSFNEAASVQFSRCETQQVCRRLVSQIGERRYDRIEALALSEHFRQDESMNSFASITSLVGFSLRCCKCSLGSIERCKEK